MHGNSGVDLQPNEHASAQLSAKQIGVLYGLALLVRLTIIALVYWQPRDDAGHYLLLAKQLVHDGTYSCTIREPGYPAFVAVLYACVGERYRLMYIAQAAISAFLPIVAYQLYRLLLPASNTAPYWLALATGVHPELASFSGVLMRESMFCVLITWLAVEMIRAVSRPTAGVARFAWVGLLAGVCCLLRTEAISFFVLFLLFAIFRSFQRFYTPRLAWVGLSTIAFVVGPWMYHNYRHCGFLGMTTVAGGNLFARAYYLDRQGSVEPEMRSLAEQVIREERYTDAQVRMYLLPPAMTRRLQATQDPFDEPALMAALKNIAVENIRRHPVPYAIDCLKQFRSLFGGYSYHLVIPAYVKLPTWAESYRTSRWGVFIWKTVNGGVFPLVMWGLLVASLFYRYGTPDWQESAFLLVAVLAYCVVASALANAENRYRENYEPILFATCARGVLAIRQAKSRRSVHCGGQSAESREPALATTSFEK